MILLDSNIHRSITLGIAANVKKQRLEMNLTQEGLAVRSGMKLPTYRKFEHTGQISLDGLLKIAFALNALQDFQYLFAGRQYASIQDVIDEGAKDSPKRGKFK